jgi:outer membrane protein TolC
MYDFRKQIYFQLLFKLIFMVLMIFLIHGCAAKKPELHGEPYSIKTMPDWKVSEYQALSSRVFQFDKYTAMQTYITQVLDNNPDLKSAAVTVKAVEYEWNAAEAGRWPEADLELSRMRSKDSLSKEISNTTSVNLNVSWVLDIWGKLSDEIDAERYLSIKSQYDLAQVKRALIVQAAQSWVEYWGYNRNAEWLMHLSKLNVDLLEHYQEAYLSGLVPYEYILEARKRKKSVQTKVLEVQLELRKLHHYMNILRGHPPSDELEVNNLNMPRSVGSFVGKISASTLANRPDIQAAFAEFLAFEFSAQAAHKALLPHIDLTGSALKSAVSLADALRGDLIWQLIGGLTQPLFNGGQLKAIAKRKSAEVEASWWQYQRIVLNAMREVEDSLTGDRQLARQLEQKQTLLADMTQKSESAQERFRVGDLQLDELFLVLAETLEAEIEVIEIEVAYIKNRLAMIASLGLSVETLWEAGGDKF